MTRTLSASLPGVSLPGFATVEEARAFRDAVEATAARAAEGDSSPAIVEAVVGAVHGYTLAEADAIVATLEAAR
jgi:hypothetical protein